MNFRFFVSLVVTMLSVFLFTVGLIMLIYINTVTKAEVMKKNFANVRVPQNSSLFSSIIDPLKSSLDGFRITKRRFNVLLLGGDTVNNNTDTIVLVNIDPVENSLNMMSIPRDTMIRGEYSTYKVNASYPIGGAKKTCMDVEKLLNINIDYFVLVNLEAFRYIVDATGGVEFKVPEIMDYDDPVQELHIHLKEGLQIMDGLSAEGLMRFRQFNNNKVSQNYDGSDLKRIQVQQMFIMEFLKQKLNYFSFSQFRDTVNIFVKHVETNFTVNDILKIANNSVNLSFENIKAFNLPGIAEEGGSWYYIFNESDFQKIAYKFETSSN